VHVGVYGEPEMTERRRRVPGLLEGAQEDGVHEPCLGPILDGVQHRLERRRRRASVIQAEAEPEALEEPGQLPNVLGIWRLVHAVQRGQPAPQQLARDGFVRG